MHKSVYVKKFKMSISAKRSYLQAVKNEIGEIMEEIEESVQVEEIDGDFDLGLESGDSEIMNEKTNVPTNLIKKGKTHRRTVSGKKGKKNYVVKNLKIKKGEVLKKDKSLLGKVLGAIYNNNAIWSNVLRLGAISKHKDNEGNIDLRFFQLFMEGKGLFLEYDFGKEQVSRTFGFTFREILPFVVLWVFDEKRIGATGWLTELEKLTKSELITRAIAEMERTIVRNKTGNKGSFLDFISAEKLNIGMFMFATFKEVEEYCEVRGIDLGVVKKDPLDDSVEKSSFIEEVRIALEILKNKCVKNVTIEYLVDIGKYSGIDGILPPDEWRFIFRNWFSSDYKFDMSVAGAPERKMRAVKDFTEVLDIGRLGWSEEFVDFWPEKKLDEFRSYFKVKSDDGRRASRIWVKEKHNPGNWYEQVFHEKIDEDFWMGLTKRQAIECFLASDIREFFGVSNKKSTIYRLNFNEDFEDKTAKVCVQQILVEYCSLKERIMMGIMSKDLAKEEFEEWFCSDHFERIKSPTEELDVGWVEGSHNFGYRHIIKRNTNDFTLRPFQEIKKSSIFGEINVGTRNNFLSRGTNNEKGKTNKESEAKKSDSAKEKIDKNPITVVVSQGMRTTQESRGNGSDDEEKRKKRGLEEAQKNQPIAKKKAKKTKCFTIKNQLLWKNVEELRGRLYFLFEAANRVIQPRVGISRKEEKEELDTRVQNIFGDEPLSSLELRDYKSLLVSGKACISNLWLTLTLVKRSYGNEFSPQVVHNIIQPSILNYLGFVAESVKNFLVAPDNYGAHMIDRELWGRGLQLIQNIRAIATYVVGANTSEQITAAVDRDIANDRLRFPGGTGLLVEEIIRDIEESSFEEMYILRVESLYSSILESMEVFYGGNSFRMEEETNSMVITIPIDVLETDFLPELRFLTNTHIREISNNWTEQSINVIVLDANIINWGRGFEEREYQRLENERNVGLLYEIMDTMARSERRGIHNETNAVIEQKEEVNNREEKRNGANENNHARVEEVKVNEEKAEESGMAEQVNSIVEISTGGKRSNVVKKNDGTAQQDVEKEKTVEIESNKKSNIKNSDVTQKGKRSHNKIDTINERMGTVKSNNILKERATNSAVHVISNETMVRNPNEGIVFPDFEERHRIFGNTVTWNRSNVWSNNNGIRVPFELRNRVFEGVTTRGERVWYSRYTDGLYDKDDRRSVTVGDEIYHNLLSPDSDESEDNGGFYYPDRKFNKGHYPKLENWRELRAIREREEAFKENKIIEAREKEERRLEERKRMSNKRDDGKRNNRNERALKSRDSKERDRDSRERTQNSRRELGRYSPIRSDRIRHDEVIKDIRDDRVDGRKEHGSMSYRMGRDNCNVQRQGGSQMEKLQENYFQSWLIHTSLLEEDGFVVTEEDSEESKKWRRNVEFVEYGVVRPKQLFFLLVERNHLEVCCTNEVGRPLFFQIPTSVHNRYVVALMIKTTDNVGMCMKARKVGFVVNGHLMIANRRLEGELFSQISAKVLLPKSRGMEGIIGVELKNKIISDALPKESVENGGGQGRRHSLHSRSVEDLNDWSAGGLPSGNGTRREDKMGNNMSVKDIQNLIESKLSESVGKNESFQKDINGVVYSESIMKIGPNATRNLEEVAVVTRQFVTAEKKEAMIGNHLLTSIDFVLLSAIVQLQSVSSEVVKSRLAKVLQNHTVFKNIILWNWNVPGSSLELDVFLPYRSGRKITNKELLVEAIINFEEFFILVFGSCWARCTEDFRRRIRDEETIVILSHLFIQECFVKVCVQMFSIIRTKCEETLFGEHWASQFALLLEKVQLTFEKQLTWQRLEAIANGGLDREGVDTETKVPDREIMVKMNKEETKKEICFKFLRKQLLLHSEGCTKSNCQRAHQEVFTWSKGYLLGQLSAVEGTEDMIQAIQEDKRFT